MSRMPVGPEKIQAGSFMVFTMNGIEVMFEVTPPPRRASAATIEKNIGKICSVLDSMPSAKYVNIPEVVEENRQGRPLFRNMDNREFGSLLSKTGREILVNKITPHFAGEAEFLHWLDETTGKFGIDSVVFVGGSNSSIKYPGPSVLRANALAAEKYPIRVGNISIPSRGGECRRLIDKTRLKCSLFTTQVLFDAGPVNQLLGQYDSECRELGMAPVPYFLSFAPIADSYDLEFCKWLGASIPKETEKEILGGAAGMDESSIEIACRIFSEILAHCKDQSVKVPLSLNIEPLSMHNLELGVKMADVLSSAVK